MLIKWEDIEFNEFKQLGPVVDEFKQLGWVVRTVPSSSHGKPKTTGSYLLVHVKTKMCYVGSHHNLYSRPYQHNSLLNRNNHWVEKFQIAYNSDPRLLVMFIITNNREEAYDIEQHILNEFHNTGLLFNIAKDARLANKGLDVSEDTRIKLSIAGSKRVLTQIHRDRIREANIGHVVSLETRNKIKDKAIARGVSPELTKLAALANNKQIYVNGVVYSSLKETASKHGITAGSVIKRIRSKHFPGWYYASDIFDKPISVRGTIYNSIDEYSLKHNLNVNIVKLRIDSNDDVCKEWKYV
jgi:group I intron endonuclease